MNALAFDALGNPVRRKILLMLTEQAMVVGEIAANLPISRPAVSKHLRVMKEAKLVKSVSRGTESVFELQKSGFDAAAEWLDQFWNNALSRYKMVAENTKVVK